MPTASLCSMVFLSWGTSQGIVHHPQFLLKVQLDCPPTSLFFRTLLFKVFDRHRLLHMHVRIENKNLSIPFIASHTKNTVCWKLNIATIESSSGDKRIRYNASITFCYLIIHNHRCANSAKMTFQVLPKFIDMTFLCKIVCCVISTQLVRSEV